MKDIFPHPPEWKCNIWPVGCGQALLTHWGQDKMTTSHYLNQWWLDNQRIYAPLGINELRWDVNMWCKTRPPARWATGFSGDLQHNYLLLYIMFCFCNVCTIVLEINILLLLLQDMDVIVLFGFNLWKYKSFAFPQCFPAKYTKKKESTLPKS